jgi:mannose-1-phosphate guanylyltransferase
MQAIILAGGRGERLRPLTDALPKPLAPVAGRPFLDFLLRFLRRQGIDEAVLLTGYLSEMIERQVGDGSAFGMTIRCVREKKPLGTGGALKNALPFLAEDFFFLNGDTLLPIDYRSLSSGAASFAALLSVFPAAGTGRAANLKLSEGGKVLSYSRRPAGGGFTHVDAGAGLFRRSLADYFPAGDVFSLEDEVYPRLIERGLLGAFPSAEDFYDIGTPAGLKRFEEYVRGNNWLMGEG